MRLIHLTAALSLVFFIAGFAWYGMKPKDSIVLFDAEAIKGTLIRQLAEHQASDEQVRVATKKFHDSLSAILADYARRHDVVIVNKRLALAGGKDVSGQIARELSRAMRVTS